VIGKGWCTIYRVRVLLYMQSWFYSFLVILRNTFSSDSFLMSISSILIPAFSMVLMMSFAFFRMSFPTTKVVVLS